MSFDVRAPLARSLDTFLKRLWQAPEDEIISDFSLEGSIYWLKQCYYLNTTVLPLSLPQLAARQPLQGQEAVSYLPSPSAWPRAGEWFTWASRRFVAPSDTSGCAILVLKPCCCFLTDPPASMCLSLTCCTLHSCKFTIQSPHCVGSSLPLLEPLKGSITSKSTSELPGITCVSRGC